MAKIYVSIFYLACLVTFPRLSFTQNLEGQIVASQFGAFQVPGIATGSLSFEPATCQVTGGGKNFVAFTAQVPLKIVDSNPALTEIDTPVAAFPGQCAVSMATTHIHATPFYVTSGTGGLQEALINGPSKSGGANTVILNADWYAQVLPGNPATVIASVKGSTALGLVDVTTSPYTYYTWNGSAYTVVSSGGGANFPSNPGIVFNTTTSVARNATSNDLITLLGTSNINANAANVWGTPALPNGTTATTQTTGDNTNKIATTAFVIANTGGATFPGTNGMVYNTGVGTSRNATSADLNTIYGYTPISAGYWSSLTGCATMGYVYSPQSNTCIAVGGGASTPATNELLMGNGTANGVIASSAGNYYVSPNISNGMNNTGTANSGANFSSNQFLFQGNFWTGSAAASDIWGFQTGSVATMGFSNDMRYDIGKLLWPLLLVSAS